MVNPASFLASVRTQGINYFVGVPDSLLKDLCAYIDDNVDGERHVISANEGNAVGLAAGWFLGAGEPALVYMQNSGLGNSVNPLTSLADPEVYSIPMLLVVGWRGAPGTNDEPQHTKQGRITQNLLEVLEIPCYSIDSTTDDINIVISEACRAMRQREGPVAILVMPGTFETYSSCTVEAQQYPLSREDAVTTVAGCVDQDTFIVSTTGKTSRELYEYRKSIRSENCRDFLTVGSMGHASSIAMALSSALDDNRVICLDGDGSVIMHMGSMAIIGQKGPGNLIHVILNNGAHESVGGQPTVGLGIDFAGIARSCGYKWATSVEDKESLMKAMTRALEIHGPIFIEVRVNKKVRDDLGRPKESPIHNRKAFMKACSSSRIG